MNDGIEEKEDESCWIVKEERRYADDRDEQHASNCVEVQHPEQKEKRSISCANRLHENQ